MNVIYIGNGVPERLCDELGYSIAGNKFSLNMAKAIDKEVNGKLDFITLANCESEFLQRGNKCEIWTDKQLNYIKKGHVYFFSDIAYSLKIVKKLFNLIKKNREKTIIILENSPTAVAMSCLLLKMIKSVPCYSITIDTPFTATFQRRGVIGKINYEWFKLGHRMLGYFDGIITFTKDVLKELEINIPCMEFAIGCTKEQIPQEDFVPCIDESVTKQIIYAGTLIYYNGIKELLEAFTELGEQYQLNVYGYGPMEKDVREAAKLNSNIHFYGRFDSQNTREVLQNCDLLINPRILDKNIENFTFPSKVIDYILAGKPVLTSEFKTLPRKYYDFIYTIDEMTSHGIAEAIKNVFEDDETIRLKKVMLGINYIAKNQTYEKIAKSISDFVEK